MKKTLLTILEGAGKEISDIKDVRRFVRENRFNKVYVGTIWAATLLFSVALVSLAVTYIKPLNNTLNSLTYDTIIGKAVIRYYTNKYERDGLIQEQQLKERFKKDGLEKYGK